MSEDFEGGGPTGRFHPDTSREGGEIDKAAQRKRCSDCVASHGPWGANAWEIWLEWGQHPEWGRRPTANNIGARLGELAPNTPAKVKNPSKPRKTYYADNGDPILWWTEETRPAERTRGHVFVAYRYRHGPRRLVRIR